MKRNQNSFLSNNEKEKIAIDSNVFRNIKFVNYLRKNKEMLQIFLPTIVTLEIGYYFLSKNISWKNFMKEMQKFDGIFLGWETIIVSEVVENAIANKATLPFRHHFRDFIIGTQCEKLNITLISYNKNHFNWIKNIFILTPEELVQEIEKKK